MATANNINLASSASGSVIVSQGAASPVTPVSASAVGGYVLLNTYTASNSATLDITSQISSTYTSYRLIGSVIKPTTNSRFLCMQFSTNNGSSWDTTAGHYASSFTSCTASVTSALSGVTDSIGFTTALDNASHTMSIIVDIITPGVSEVYAIWTAYCVSASLAFCSVMGGGNYNQASAINAIRLLMNGGNINTGTFKFYGFTA